jgi:iron complex transport system ATP-binding protein
VKLRAESLAFSYPGRPVLEDVTLDVPEGILLGLVGPNVAGKSTLLRCMHGALEPDRGRVLLDGQDLGSLSRREIARRVGVVPQTCTPAFPVSVAQFVGMGRYAREPFLGGPSPQDAEVVRRCLEEMAILPLADRPIDEISGGEFRRVLVAQALAQEPSVLLFDEPVQQLDLLHQLEVMEFARDFTRRDGTAAVVVLHDLGLSARFCDRLVLLHRGRILAVGTPEEVLTVENLKEAYGVNAFVSRCPATGSVQVVALSGRDGAPGA